MPFDISPKDLFDRTTKVGDCWVWNGAPVSGGYGRLKINRKSYLVHRLAYEICKGEIPAGLNVLHECDTPLCINPDHLIAGTQSKNICDMFARGRGEAQRGEFHYRSSLTAADVREIRNNQHVRRAELAARYGVSASAIEKVILRATWKHI